MTVLKDARTAYIIPPQVIPRGGYISHLGTFDIQLNSWNFVIVDQNNSSSEVIAIKGVEPSLGNGRLYWFEAWWVIHSDAAVKAQVEDGTTIRCLWPWREEYVKIQPTAPFWRSDQQGLRWEWCAEGKYDG